MAAVGFVAEYETTWNVTTTPRTVSVTVAAGDCLVIFGSTDDQSCTLATPTGGGLTYTLRQSNSAASFCSTYMWTAFATSAQTFTMSVAATGAGQFGFNALRFSGVSKIGASGKTVAASTAPTLTFTTSAANPAIVMCNSDWTDNSGARTYRTAGVGTFTEQTFAATGNYAIGGGFYLDAGVPGSKTVGLSAPTGQSSVLLAVELIPAARPVLVPGGAVQRSANW